jgi:RNA polymerase sigma-70 factor (ECF subfamily)
MIVTNLCYDYLKKHKPVYEPEILEISAIEPNTPHQIAEKKEADRRIKQALHNLPLKQRLAVTLKYYGQMSYEEIAAATKTSLKAVEKNLGRARKNLLVILGTKEGLK